MKTKIFSSFLIVMVMSGCVWFEDDDDCAHCNEYREHIAYINHTEFYIDHYIDGVFVGSCTPFTDFHLYGDNYEGYHTYFSACGDCDLEWGPTQFFVDEGGTLRIILDYPPAAGSTRGEMYADKTDQ